MSGGKSILKNAFTVGALTALSRVLGLVREMLQATVVGAGVAQSAFALAFALPNMARKLFGEGALTAAFVPVFKGVAEKESLERAARLARSVMTMVVLMLSACVILSFGALDLGVRFKDAFGLEDSERLRLTVRLVKTLLPYMVFICGAAFGMGVLNSLGRFTASSFMPCLLNVCCIATLGWLAFCPWLSPGECAQRVAVAILVAGALQMAFLFWRMAKAGVAPRLTFSGWGDEKVRLVWRNLGVAAMGAGAVQVNYMLDQVLAQLAAPWAAGVISYSERLMDLPLGVVGVAFGTVLLPTFAGLFAKGDVEGAKSALSSSLRSLMFVMLPSAAGLFVLAPEMTRAIYEGGAFDAAATVRVSRAVAVYALGLGFFSFQKTLVPWFQAQSDMKTPLRVSVVAVCLNAALNILAVATLPEEWRHVGLAASTVVCAGFSCAFLYVLARRRNGSLGLASCVGPVARMAAASVSMAIVVWFLKPFAESLAAPLSPRAASVAALSVLVAAGVAAYGALALVLMPDAARGLIRRFRAPRRAPR